jgi:transposase InsO family protein
VARKSAAFCGDVRRKTVSGIRADMRVPWAAAADWIARVRQLISGPGCRRAGETRGKWLAWGPSQLVGHSPHGRWQGGPMCLRWAHPGTSRVERHMPSGPTALDLGPIAGKNTFFFSFIPCFVFILNSILLKSSSNLSWSFNHLLNAQTKILQHEYNLFN